MCKCLWVVQLFECSGAKLHVASYMIELKIQAWAVWVPAQQYCSQSIPQCTQTISLWVSTAALWKHAAPRTASFDHVACAAVPWVCSLPWLGLFTQTFSFCVHYHWLTVLFLGGVFFCRFFANASSWKTGSNSKYLRFLAKFPVTWFHLLHSVKLFTCTVLRR